MSLAFYMDVHVPYPVTAGLLEHGIEFTGLIYAHQQSIGIGKFIADLHLITRTLEPWEMVNRVEFLPL